MTRQEQIGRVLGAEDEGPWSPARARAYLLHDDPAGLGAMAKAWEP